MTRANGQYSDGSGVISLESIGMLEKHSRVDHYKGNPLAVRSKYRQALKIYVLSHQTDSRLTRKDSLMNKNLREFYVRFMGRMFNQSLSLTHLTAQSWCQIREKRRIGFSSANRLRMARTNCLTCFPRAGNSTPGLSDSFALRAPKQQQQTLPPVVVPDCLTAERAIFKSNVNA